MLRLPIKSTIFLLFNFSILSGQSLPDSKISNSKHFCIDVKRSNGIIIPHHESLTYLIEDYTAGYELNFGRSNFGSDNWEKYFNYPEIGIGLKYTTLGNQDIFGEGVSVYPYVNFIISRTARFNASYKVAWGISYITKPYSASNNMNMAIGSHFNAYISAGLLLEYRILKHYSLSGALSLHHFSNGSEKKPNKGLNLVDIGLGVKYHFNEDLYPPRNKNKAPKLNRFELLTVIYGARSQGGLFYNTKTSFSGGITNTLLFNRNFKSAYGGGVDIRYYAGASYSYDGNYMKMHYDFEDYLYSSVYLAFHRKMGKLAMFFHLGAYLTSGIKPSQPVYPRIGFKYDINKKLVAHFGLKASFFAAEYIELGVGYRFQL